MHSVTRLLDVIVESWTRCLPKPYGDGEFSPKDGSTDCNRHVHQVCSTYAGYAKFIDQSKASIMLANEMIDTMTAHPEDWMLLPDGKMAQWHTNQGGLVIAAWKNPTGGHGHVCPVFPGSLGTSGKWGIGANDPAVPKVANVGPEERCRLDRGANYAFGEIPRYFLLKQTSS